MIVTNSIYGDMKVVKYLYTNKYYVKYYEVECTKCGHKKQLSLADLNSLKSCNHSNKFCEIYLEEYDDNIGKVYDDIKIIKLHSITKHGYRYIVKCQVCGREKDMYISNIKRHYGTTHEWCIKLITNKNYFKRFAKIHSCMLYRTTNENYPEWYLYGGRGITVCNRWFSLINFYDDMFDSYIEHCKTYGEKDTTIDRINTNDNYYKENCRWATYKKQANNKNTNTFITYLNKTKTMMEWCDLLNLNYSNVFNRIHNLNWDIDKAFEYKTFK